MGQTHAVSTFSPSFPGGGAGAGVCINAMDVDAATSVTNAIAGAIFISIRRVQKDPPYIL
jgi:hypothetical protein